jgi:hypothetical protein
MARVAVQATKQITGQRKWWAFATVLLTMLFASMDQTVVSTAMPTIIGDLHGFNLYAWVFSWSSDVPSIDGCCEEFIDIWD